MDELIQSVEKLRLLRRNHPDIALSASDTVVKTATEQLNAVITNIEARVTEQREERASNAPGLADLLGFVDLSGTAPVNVEPTSPQDDQLEPVVLDAPLPTGAVAAESATDEGDDEYDEYEDEEEYDVPAADLVAEVIGEDVDDKTTIQVIEAALPSIHERLGRYEIQIVNDGTAVLTAPDNFGIARGAQPAGTEVFRAPVADLVGAVVVLKVAGPEDPENPAVAPGDAVRNVLERLEELETPIAPVETLQLVFDRLDDDELTQHLVQEQILPVALRSLSMLLGEHTVQDVVDGDTPAQKVVRLLPAGDGELDRRALSIGYAQFDGILPFPGIGRVRAHARVG